MNTQFIEKPSFISDGDLDVHSCFRTIQGEGPFAGSPAVFLRLAGCNLCCPKCDTDYTSERVRLTPDEVVRLVNKKRVPYRVSLVVLTGGEPFRQNISPTVNKLLSAGYRIQIETNGTLYQPGPWHKVTIVCSPKTGIINGHLLHYIKAYKYVLSIDDVDPTDGLPIHSLNGNRNVRIDRPPESYGGPIYLQPLDEGKDHPDKNELNLQACIESCMNYGYILCLQQHKLIGMP